MRVRLLHRCREVFFFSSNSSCTFFGSASLTSLRSDVKNIMMMSCVMSLVEYEDETEGSGSLVIDMSLGKLLASKAGECSIKRMTLFSVSS